ncbi:recombinase family protein [Roseovarius sp. LXJ103]|uniref:recombinase family protein n=1 Tax=Roseovarius carneus TaxID=2853164 RepID=UPI000D60ED5D|nr:recombinase family protein [Roseovarius carneus]MBZ8117374.1 recombinase family protein [Roseovarius carneus]PWE36808.1 hypothetical protein DD563_13130 [Pelagicola sp. LXJ1103]
MSRKKEVAGSPQRAVRGPAFGYIRVSTQSQGQTGISLEAQRGAIETFSQAMGYDLIEVLDDVASGMGPESFCSRRGLRSALEAANSNNAVVIVLAWDRLTRYSKFENQLRKIAFDPNRVVCIEEVELRQNGSKAAIHKYNEVMGQRISSGTKAALDRLRSNGVVLGNPSMKTSVQPLGAQAYSRKSTDLVRQIADMLMESDDPFSVPSSTVVIKLKERGIRTMQSKEWTASRLREPLKKARRLIEEREAPEPPPTFGMF